MKSLQRTSDFPFQPGLNFSVSMLKGPVLMNMFPSVFKLYEHPPPGLMEGNCVLNEVYEIPQKSKVILEEFWTGQALFYTF